MKERNHFYTYTVTVRCVTERVSNGKLERVTEWKVETVPHCSNMHEVAGRLHQELDNIRYEWKERE